MIAISFCVSTLALFSLGTGASEPLWWERGADKWYYKDDWKGLLLSGGRTYTKTINFPTGVVSGWIVVWGDNGYKLTINNQLIATNIDEGLIDDYDLSEYLSDYPDVVTITIESNRICAEGEFIDQNGIKYPFATGDDWRTDGNGFPRTAIKASEPSTGAYHRAHNGRLMTYNDEERGKTAIAKALARIQKLNDQGIFLMRRFRPAEEIISFEPDVLWRRAESFAAPLIEEARSIINEKAIPAQKSGDFNDAIKATGEAAIRISWAESAIYTVKKIYLAQRNITHIENWRKMVAPEEQYLIKRIDELRELLNSARDQYILNDWSSSMKAIDRIWEYSETLNKSLESIANRKLGQIIGGIGSLDEFPEDRFGWLNGRELMGNDPSNWIFHIFPYSYIPLNGKWYFQTDPDNSGESQGWHLPEKDYDGWKDIIVPKPWERQGFTEDNLKSPGDAPYKLGDARCGDKPYNGFAWYKKTIFIPDFWKDKKVILSVGKIQNWGRIFINGKPLGEGKQNPPEKYVIPDGFIQFGKENSIAIQVYNHDNFGGIVTGNPAIYMEGAEPELKETPGPVSYVKEYKFPTKDSTARITLLASAMSPGVVVTTDSRFLKLSGWEAKGYKAPNSISYMGKEGFQTNANKYALLDGKELTEDWVLLKSDDADILVVLEKVPSSIIRETDSINSNSIIFEYEKGPVHAVILTTSPGQLKDENSCRFWSRALKRYPVSASECVISQPEKLIRKYLVKYNYLAIGSSWDSNPIYIAPLPMLASYGLKYNHPNLKAENLETTEYNSMYAPYRVLINSQILEYSAPAIDRSKVMKGVGELFGKHKAEYNVRGGVSEDEMFRRMGEWGFDHCRYAWAFHAEWDLPLVKFMGGPIIEDNEAMWKRLDEFVDKCNKAGMQMMLCWFFNEDSPQKDAGGAVRNSTRYWRLKPETKKNAFELWRRIAERYADRPEWAISYDFFNEPAYMNMDHWKEIMKELTEIIRSVDKKHLIVWESADGWAQPQWSLWMEPVNDPNVIYSFHHYGKHWGYAYDEYYPGYASTSERTHIDPWLEAILFSIRYNVPIHCGEFGISMIQPDNDGEAWLNDYLAFFERFGIGWNWWNYSGGDIYRTGLAAGNRISPYVPILRKYLGKIFPY